MSEGETGRGKTSPPVSILALFAKPKRRQGGRKRERETPQVEGRAEPRGGEREREEIPKEAGGIEREGERARGVRSPVNLLAPSPDREQGERDREEGQEGGVVAEASEGRERGREREVECVCHMVKKEKGSDEGREREREGARDPDGEIGMMLDQIDRLERQRGIIASGFLEMDPRLRPAPSKLKGRLLDIQAQQEDLRLKIWLRRDPGVDAVHSYYYSVGGPIKDLCVLPNLVRRVNGSAQYTTVLPRLMQAHLFGSPLNHCPECEARGSRVIPQLVFDRDCRRVVGLKCVGWKGLKKADLLPCTWSVDINPENEGVFLSRGVRDIDGILDSFDRTAGQPQVKLCNCCSQRVSQRDLIGDSGTHYQICSHSDRQCIRCSEAYRAGFATYHASKPEYHTARAAAVAQEEAAADARIETDAVARAIIRKARESGERVERPVVPLVASSDPTVNVGPGRDPEALERHRADAWCTRDQSVAETRAKLKKLHSFQLLELSRKGSGNRISVYTGVKGLRCNNSRLVQRVLQAHVFGSPTVMCPTCSPSVLPSIDGKPDPEAIPELEFNADASVVTGLRCVGIRGARASSRKPPCGWRVDITEANRDDFMTRGLVDNHGMLESLDTEHTKVDVESGIHPEVCRCCYRFYCIFRRHEVSCKHITKNCQVCQTKRKNAEVEAHQRKASIDDARAEVQSIAAQQKEFTEFKESLTMQRHLVKQQLDGIDAKVAIMTEALNELRESRKKQVRKLRILLEEDRQLKKKESGGQGPAQK
ncbi:hypothetical protein KIPB_003717 [Kipferlia bialata]|uniref:Uncharacterized protein n=1 Tax=Kipferlia bialata TaxID=797122 RepID=A0A9K3GH88_9EUKA|nr:hypothetical protein KIPB_003717 [Kipferlia bialata]|eukprot:g3717.t1